MSLTPFIHHLLERDEDLQARALAGPRMHFEPAVRGAHAVDHRREAVGQPLGPLQVRDAHAVVGHHQLQSPGLAANDKPPDRHV